MICFLLIYKPNTSKAQVRAQNTDSLLNSKPFINWARDHAFPLQNSDSALGYTDLQPIKRMIGNARVVALGEPSHGFHEPLGFRNRMFHFLVENCGFTTVVLEGGFAESRMAADFVAGGPGTAKDAAAKLTIGEPSGENIELLQWIRDYNANPAHRRKLEFYGMDIQLRGFPGDTTPAHAAIDEALSYLDKVVTVEGVKIKSVLSSYLSRLSVSKYPLLSSEDRIRLSATLDDLIALFEREQINFIGRSSKANYEWGYRNAVVAQLIDRMVRVMPPDQPGKIPPDAWMLVNARDAAMADNVMWILDHRADGGKVLVFSHNAHVKNDFTVGGVWDAFAKPPNSTGQYLKSMLGNDLFIIGSSCAPSMATAQPGSLDNALLQVGKSRYIIDLRAAAGNSSVASWLRKRRPMESNKVSYLMIDVSNAFDAILFIK